jgi:anti-sigma-K factor RskA
MNGEQLNCERLSDAAPWVLGALPDASEYREHLETCEFCREEVALLQPSADVLAGTVAPEPAPPALIASVMATVRAEAELLAAAGPEADRPKRRRRITRPRAFALGTGLATVIAVAVVAVFALSGNQRTVDGEILAKGMPATASVSLVGPNDSAKLKVGGVPAAAAGRTYEVWLQQPDGSMKPTSALFSGDGSVSVPNLEGSTAVYVTVEPAGGSQQPTTKPIMRVQLPSQS